MKVLIIGASGKIGGAIHSELASDTDIITANHRSGDFTIDLGNHDSIVELFKKVGKLDGIVCAAARGVAFKPLAEMTLSDYVTSMQQKLLGQISIVLNGIPCLNDHGSITLTTGVMNRQYVKNGSAAAMVNNAVEGFVKAAAFTLPRGIRLNVVSPGLLEASAKAYADICPGFEPVSAETVARTYRKSVYGIMSGQVFSAD